MLLYIDAFSHTQLTLLTVFVIRQIVSASSMGQHQAFEQECTCIQTLSAMR